MKFTITKNVVIEERNEIPIVRTVDVIVAGGGTAGIPAAIASARNGAKTLLIEELGFLGGTMTGALVCQTTACAPAIGGIFSELLDRMIEKGQAVQLDKINAYWDPESCKDEAAAMLIDSNVEPLLYTEVIDPIIQDNQIRGVIISSPSGKQAILGKVVIDCTGDADVAFKAGAPCIKGREDDSKMRPISILSRMGNVDIDQTVKNVLENPSNFYRDPGQHIMDLEHKVFRIVGFFEEAKQARMRGEIHPECHYIRLEMIFPDKKIVTVNSSRVYNVDATDGFSLTKATFEGRKQGKELEVFLKKYIPGFQNSYLLDMAAVPGVRETRRIRGEYLLTTEDIAESKVFSDSIAKNSMSMEPGHETHSPDGGEGSEDHAFYRTLLRTIRSHTIPYRCLLPKQIEGLLVAGRTISVTHSADDWTRNMPPCMLVGQAAGTAASIACRKGVNPRQIDVSELQNLLIKQGVDLGKK